MSKEKIRFIVNPISGHGNKKNFPLWVDSLLDKSIYDFDLCYTECVGHAKDLANQAISDGCQVVAAVGGDGTVNEVACALINSDVSLAIVPLGSGNGLARTLHLPLNPQQIIQKVINVPRVKTIDTAVLNGLPFVSVAGFGLDAETADAFAKDGHRGLLTYGKIAADKYFHAHLEKCMIQIDEAPAFECEPLMLTVANSTQFGYEAKIAPHALLDDALLDVCILAKPALPAAPIVAIQLMNGHIDHSRYFKSFKAQKIMVQRTKNAVVNIDGEPVMMDQNLQIEVKPNSLKVLF